LFHVTYYRRNLPHWLPEGKTLFITWRLYGSLPRTVEAPGGRRTAISGNNQFKEVDKALDRADFGPTWLKAPKVAACVVGTLLRGSTELHHYVLHAFVVMANHVHVLLTPRTDVRRLMKSIKGVTAREANRVLERTGKPFWQDESFDHWVRNEIEFNQFREYIEQNPVTAGLVERPGDWPWSSATRNS
jgi:putative transposase